AVAACGTGADAVGRAARARLARVADAVRAGGLIELARRRAGGRAHATAARGAGQVRAVTFLAGVDHPVAAAHRDADLRRRPVVRELGDGDVVRRVREALAVADEADEERVAAGRVVDARPVGVRSAHVRVEADGAAVG